MWVSHDYPSCIIKASVTLCRLLNFCSFLHLSSFSVLLITPSIYTIWTFFLLSLRRANYLPVYNQLLEMVRVFNTVQFILLGHEKEYMCNFCQNRMYLPNITHTNACWYKWYSLLSNSTNHINQPLLPTASCKIVTTLIFCFSTIIILV